MTKLPGLRKDLHSSPLAHWISEGMAKKCQLVSLKGLLFYKKGTVLALGEKRRDVSGHSLEQESQTDPSTKSSNFCIFCELSMFAHL